MADDAALDLMDRFANFIVASPTSYHAAAEVARQLSAAGWAQQDETRPWSDDPGGHFFVRDGAVMAWWVPEEITPSTGIRVVGSHTDSPTLKLKPNPNVTNAGWQQVGMEIYGGPLLNSWLDRELGLAGRLVSDDGSTHLVRTGPVLRIAQVAPHLDRSVNDNLHLDRQQHMMPIFTTGRPDADVVAYLAEQAHLDPTSVAAYDVLAAVTEAPAVFGPDAEFFAAWRMDNLSSVFASLDALLTADFGPDIAAMAAFDHEEIGSATRTGAAGPILEETLRRIALSLGFDGDAFYQLMARSSCISADAGHAVHPNYTHLHDPQNRPLLNEGPLLKLNANHRYASEATGSALWYRACERADVPTQEFVSNNAVSCGSTIGPLTATRLGLTTVDVGIPLLSMHSAREMCGTADVRYLALALAAYWEGA